MAPGQVWGLLLAGLSLWPGLAGARAPVPAAPPEVPGPLGPAEQEQSHYLAQLFGLYGENGTLTVGGLARLLHSLGLGRVQGLRLEHRGALEGRPGPLPEGNTTQRPLEPGLSLDVWSGLPTGPSLWGAREEPGGPSSPRGPPSPNLDLFHRLLLLDHSLADHLHEDCLNGSQLLVNFGLSPAAPLTPGQFALLCPALLYQIDSRVCIRPTLPPAPSGDLLAALAHSSLAVLLLSVPTPLSLLLLRLVGGQRLRPLLGFLGSLAVGTLCGDALLHLLPHAQGGRHSGSGSAGELGPGLALLGGLFLLFLLENLLGLLRPKCHRRRRRDLGVQDPEDPSGAALQTLGLGHPWTPGPRPQSRRGRRRPQHDLDGSAGGRAAQPHGRAGHRRRLLGRPPQRRQHHPGRLLPRAAPRTGGLRHPAPGWAAAAPTGPAERGLRGLGAAGRRHGRGAQPGPRAPHPLGLRGHRRRLPLRGSRGHAAGPAAPPGAPSRRPRAAAGTGAAAGRRPHADHRAAGRPDAAPGAGGLTGPDQTPPSPPNQERRPQARSDRSLINRTDPKATSS
ncbi:zinc transporter ZIP5 isoform X1 [Ornithorhynchus anatinus]|uniref:zinc transporter ZIP5 isoform X1 n=1 Tax=Ornithorhynchus anatinus TaxID=9258 RepID=UPI0010A84236|nr:zinc transporter ZIP5 isoform X1 [Ornithorhynchus anatinus]XP_028929047.1 zinc transporter ZIP5 isoform X1 [Ornithorhynchus anatinus]XP_028929048.1 zinc transporter ZIP5 isoform X1 [Ornithorhynchus anatinus]XP_028929049.1 zinc transporter ZIP5 isoform X1 [Ornithorhynchus anatinus]